MYVIIFSKKKREEYVKEERLKRLNSLKDMDIDGLSVMEKLEKFRYIKV